MKNRFFLLAFVVSILFGSCVQEDKVPFTFVVSGESVTEGESLPVSVAITKGPTTGYGLSSRVERYDISTSGVETTSYVLSYGEMPADGGYINFEDFGKRDFHIDGMTAGTYMVSVVLTRDDYSDTQSVVVVVKKKEEEEPGNENKPPVAEKPVESFELWGLELNAGTLILEPGNVRRYNLSWTPIDATSPSFSVVTSDRDVVDVALSGRTVEISAVAAGEALVTVMEAGGLSKSIPVLVKRIDAAIESFEINGLNLSGGYLVMEDNAVNRYDITWSPSDATKTTFEVSSSDESVVMASESAGVLTISALYPGTATITVSAPDGPVKTFPVKVYKDVKVTVAWYEPSATEAQISTKTFPCYLRFSSDSDKAFPSPIVWTVTMKGVVNVTGRDTQSVTSKQDVKFYGNRAAQYDVTSNVLIPCYSIYRTSAFTLSLTLTLQRNDSLDPEYWRISYDEKYKTQDARIWEYITSIQQ